MASQPQTTNTTWAEYLLPAAHCLPREDTTSADEFAKAGKHAKRSAQHTGAAFSKAGEVAADEVQDGAASVRDTLADGANYVKDRLSSAGSRAEDYGNEARKNGEEAYYSTKRSVKETAHNLSERAEENLEEGKKEAKGLFGSIKGWFVSEKEEAKDTLHRNTHTGRKDVDSPLDEVENKASRVGGQIRDTAEEAWDKTKGYLQETSEEVKARGRSARDDAYSGRGQSRANGATRETHHALDTANDYAHAGVDKTSSALDKAGNYLSDTAHSVEDGIRGTKRQVRNSLEATKDEIYDGVQSVKDSFVNAAEAAQPKSSWEALKAQGFPPSNTLAELRKGRRAY